MSEHKTVIVLGNNIASVTQLVTKIKRNMGKHVDVVQSMDAIDAVSLIPPGEDCVVISESCVSSGKTASIHLTSGNEHLLVAGKKVNQACKFIIYDSLFIQKEKERFDCYVNKAHKDAFRLLVDKIRQYLKTKNYVFQKPASS